MHFPLCESCFISFLRAVEIDVLPSYFTTGEEKTPFSAFDVFARAPCGACSLFTELAASQLAAAPSCRAGHPFLCLMLRRIKLPRCHSDPVSRVLAATALNKR